MWVGLKMVTFSFFNIAMQAILTQEEKNSPRKNLLNQFIENLDMVRVIRKRRKRERERESLVREENQGGDESGKKP